VELAATVDEDDAAEADWRETEVAVRVSPLVRASTGVEVLV